MAGAPSPRIERLDAEMRGAGFPARLSDDIQADMWEKWDQLAALGAITCLMRGNVGEVNAARGGKEFILGLLDEVVAVVTAEGHPPRPAFVAEVRKSLTDPASTRASAVYRHPPRPAFVAEVRKSLTDPASTGTSSMYRDLQQGRPIEAEQIIGDMLARG